MPYVRIGAPGVVCHGAIPVGIVSAACASRAVISPSALTAVTPEAAASCARKVRRFIGPGVLCCSEKTVCSLDELSLFVIGVLSLPCCADDAPPVPYLAHFFATP